MKAQTVERVCGDNVLDAMGSRDRQLIIRSPLSFERVFVKVFYFVKLIFFIFLNSDVKNKF
jgi:hypothetical protein